MNKLWGRAHKNIKMVTSGTELDGELPKSSRPPALDGGTFTAGWHEWYQKMMDRKADAIAACVVPPG